MHPCNLLKFLPLNTVKCYVENTHFFHCLLCSPFWLEEPQISRVLNSMRTGVYGQVGSAKPEQCSAPGVVPYFSCKYHSSYWTITIEQLSQ